MKTKRPWSFPASPFTSSDYALINNCGGQEARHRLKTLVDHKCLDKTSHSLYSIKPAAHGNQGALETP